jgi:hypothetical protein
MAIKVKGALEEKVRGLLGEGKNLTERRIADLLTELEQRRALADATPDPNDSERPVPTAEPNPVPAPVVGNSDPEKDALYKVIAGLEAKIKENAQTPAKEMDQEIGAGRLPLPSAQAPPLGLTGLGDIPLGKWITSPIGPKVPYIICGCGKCTHARLEHWYCSVCRSGPHHYKQRYPHFSKNWMYPGGVWGVNHTMCSENCRMSYLSQIGVVAGVNDHEPLRGDIEGGDPLRPVTAPDSD